MVEAHQAARRGRHRPGGGGTACRREAAALEEAGHETVSLSTHGALAPVECQLATAHLLDRKSPPHAAGFSPRRAAGLPWLQPVLLRFECGPRVLTTVARWGLAPVDRVDRGSRCRQHGAAGAPPSPTAVPAGLAPVPPRALPRRSRAPAGREPTRSV